MAASSSGGRRWWRRWWPVVRWLLGVGLLVVGVEVLSAHTDELSGFGQVIGHLRWGWLAPACAVEAVSLLSFAAVQYKLLAAGGVRVRPVPLFGMNLASQAITNSLPGGTAVATVYGFRWYRRFGADDALAGWAMVGSGVAAILSLALLAAAGVGVAAELGASLDLVPVVLGVLAVAVAVAALFVYERPLAFVAKQAVRVSKRLFGRPRGDLEQEIVRLVHRVTVVRLGWGQIGGVVGWALASWLFDCSCFALSFLLIGAGIPWKGLLLAYGAGQLAANLPITPGGLGAVEGSLTIALAYFGGARTTTVDAVLVYRIISFWAVLAVGWMAWGWGALGIRRGRWPRRALAAPVAVSDPEVPGSPTVGPVPGDVPGSPTVGPVPGGVVGTEPVESRAGSGQVGGGVG